MKLDKMTLGELEGLSNDLDGQRMVVRDQMREVRREIDKRLAAESAEKLLERMSDAEKMALVQMIQAQGVGSAESIGGLTAK